MNQKLSEYSLPSEEKCVVLDSAEEELPGASRMTRDTAQQKRTAVLAILELYLNLKN